MSLNPCPFCSDEKPKTEFFSKYTTIWCEMCGAAITRPTTAEVIAAWNARPAAPVAGSVKNEMDTRPWMPPHEAPTDGTEVWIYLKGKVFRIRAFYCRDRESWASADGSFWSGSSVVGWLPILPTTAAQVTGSVKRLRLVQHSDGPNHIAYLDDHPAGAYVPYDDCAALSARCAELETENKRFRSMVLERSGDIEKLEERCAELEREMGRIANFDTTVYCGEKCPFCKWDASRWEHAPDCPFGIARLTSGLPKPSVIPSAHPKPTDAPVCKCGPCMGTGRLVAGIAEGATCPTCHGTGRKQ